MRVLEKLSHLSLSISTWHLGRASSEEAAYPCGQASPCPIPSAGHRACPLWMEETFGFLWLFSHRPPSQAGSPSRSPGLFSRAQTAFSPGNRSSTLLFLSGCLMFYFDVHIWALGGSWDLKCVSGICRILWLRGKRVFLSLFSWKPALGTIWNHLFGMCTQSIRRGWPIPSFPLPAVPVSVPWLLVTELC